MADLYAMYNTPCRLKDTLERYSNDQPLGVDAPIDISTATDAFICKHLQAALAEEALRKEQRENAEYSVEWEEDDGKLSVPGGQWQAVHPLTLTAPGSSTALASPAPKGPKEKGRRQRGHRALRKIKGHTVGELDKRAGAFKKNREQLENLVDGAALYQGEVSLLRDGSRTKTGWNGKRPPPHIREEIQELHRVGAIGEFLVDFTRIPHTLSSRKPTLLFDQDKLLFLVRTSQFPWLKALGQDFHRAVYKLLGDTLANAANAKACEKLQRGPHLPCILGHSRQYSENPVLTEFHTSHYDACEAFIQEPVIRSIINWASSLVRLYFPAIADRYQQCINWHHLQTGTQAMFGLFFQFCVNGIFSGQKRVHCHPHTDSKNVIGVCLLMVYENPDKPFDHKRRSWLVVWEPSVMLELPPWVAVLYPSALFLHFNIDLKDIKLVTAPEGEIPTRENSEEIGSEEGRGSIVFFNQASLFQSSETNSSTLKAAAAQGKVVTSDFAGTAQTLFTTYATKQVFRPEI